jgi:hypothetical protein
VWSICIGESAIGLLEKSSEVQVSSEENLDPWCIGDSVKQNTGWSIINNIMPKISGFFNSSKLGQVLLGQGMGFEVNF